MREKEIEKEYTCERVFMRERERERAFGSCSSGREKKRDKILSDRVERKHRVDGRQIERNKV